VSAAAVRVSETAAPTGAARPSTASESPVPALRVVVGLVVLAGVAGILLWIGGTALRLERVARERIADWKPVTATVQEVSVESRRAGKSGLAWAPVVRYTYVVDGAGYTATRVTVLDEASTKPWADRIAAHYHPGETVTAFYDPLHPGEAYLVSIGAGAGLWIVALAVVPIALAVRLVLRMRRSAATGST
jgi:hypothetical protein